jgi:transcriptional regulator with XRE-family HTH domain
LTSFSILLTAGGKVPGKASYRVPIDAKTIGNRLRAVRTSRGITQVEIAAKLGMTQALISDYERGKLRLHGGLIVAFAQVLRTSSDEILGIKSLKINGHLRDRRFLRRLDKIDRLGKRDKQALLRNIDNFLRGAGVT